jgi:hypothetical protein
MGILPYPDKGMMIGYVFNNTFLSGHHVHALFHSKPLILDPSISACVIFIATCSHLAKCVAPDYRPALALKYPCVFLNLKEKLKCATPFHEWLKLFYYNTDIEDQQMENPFDGDKHVSPEVWIAGAACRPSTCTADGLTEMR